MAWSSKGHFDQVQHLSRQRAVVTLPLLSQLIPKDDWHPQSNNNRIFLLVHVLHCITGVQAHDYGHLAG